MCLIWHLPFLMTNAISLSNLSTNRVVITSLTAVRIGSSVETQLCKTSGATWRCKKNITKFIQRYYNSISKGCQMMINLGLFIVFLLSLHKMDDIRLWAFPKQLILVAMCLLPSIKKYKRYLSVASTLTAISYSCSARISKMKSENGN